ncbi:MlaE family lipid ABC transporter permease subunit [Sphingomonas arantia]|uniref:MlaE family lipid ABC transporter permease subunit n=1 Tax=Sphingomonas arantia TaxID=1460676 RepID=A0ABW4TYJ0_9SPHN
MSGAEFTNDDGVLRFRGTMTLARLGDVVERVDAIDTPPTAIDLSGIERIDTVGAWIVHRLVRDHDIPVQGADENTSRLLEQVAAADRPAKVRPDATPSFVRVLGQIGDAVAQAGHTLIGLTGFFGATLVAAWGVIRHPRRFRYNAVARQFEVVGVEALAIVGLMSFLIGVVIAQQGAIQLRQFGAEVFAINLIGRITFRELGVLMTAIMVAGRSGSAFAAQIGSMRLAEEVDAMRTIGVSPMEALVLPRVLATVLLMPLLGFYASLLALLGGGLFTWISLDIPPITFITRIREVVPLTDVLTGLIKAPVFGLIIAMAGCFQGMQVEGSAEAVGLRTTSAVVQSIFLVIIINAVFAVFFASIGWV